jgi:glucose dehydrogenase
MMNNSDAINLHKCIKYIEEEVYSDTSPKEIEFDGVLIEYKFDEGGEIIVNDIVFAGVRQPSLRKEVQEYFSEIE